MCTKKFGCVGSCGYLPDSVKNKVYIINLYHCCLNPSISLYVLLDKANTLKIKWQRKPSVRFLMSSEVKNTPLEVKVRIKVCT